MTYGDLAVGSIFIMNERLFSKTKDDGIYRPCHYFTPGLKCMVIWTLVGEAKPTKNLNQYEVDVFGWGNTLLYFEDLKVDDRFYHEGVSYTKVGGLGIINCRCNRNDQLMCAKMKDLCVADYDISELKDGRGSIKAVPINAVYGFTGEFGGNMISIADDFDGDRSTRGDIHNNTSGVWAGRTIIPHIIAGMNRADDFDGDIIASVPIDWPQKSDSNNEHGMTGNKPAEPTPYDRHLSELETGDMFIIEGDKDYVYEMLGRNGLATLLGYDAGKLYIKKIFNGEVRRIPGDTKVFFLRKSNPAANPASTRLTPIHAKALKIGTQFMMSGASNDNIYEIVPDPDVFGTAKKREHVWIMNLNTGMLLHCALDLWVYRMDEPTKAVEPTPYDTALSTLNVGDYFEMQGDTDMYSVNDSCEVFPSAVIVKAKMLNVFNITKQIHTHVSPDTMVCFVRADKPVASISSASPARTLLGALHVGDQYVTTNGISSREPKIYEVVPNTDKDREGRVKVFSFSDNRVLYFHPGVRVLELGVKNSIEAGEPLGTLTFYDGRTEAVRFCRAMGCGLIVVGTDSEVYMYNTFARKLFCSPDDILIDTDYDCYRTKSTLSLCMDSINNFEGWQMTNELHKKLENELKKYS